MTTPISNHCPKCNADDYTAISYVVLGNPAYETWIRFNLECNQCGKKYRHAYRTDLNDL